MLSHMVNLTSILELALLVLTIKLVLGFNDIGTQEHSARD